MSLVVARNAYPTDDICEGHHLMQLAVRLARVRLMLIQIVGVKWLAWLTPASTFAFTSLFRASACTLPTPPQ